MALFETNDVAGFLPLLFFSSIISPLQSFDRYSKLVSARPIPLLAAPVSAYTDTDTVLEGSIGDTDTDTVMSRKYSRNLYQLVMLELRS